MSARAYTVWRLDCDCGAVYEVEGDEPPTECEECGETDVDVKP